MSNMTADPQYIADVIQEGRFVKAITRTGINVSSEIERSVRRLALKEKLPLFYNKAMGSWSLDNNISTSTNDSEVSEINLNLHHTNDVTDQTIQFIHGSVSFRPKDLIISDLKWKYLVRSAIRGKNIMLVGESGSGKTKSARALVRALDRPDFYFNLGSTQDPRSSLIGNTHFSKDSGTYFSESLFIKAIQTENAVILLDEISRAHPEAWNILMTVLDPEQRYLRIDERDDTPTINVAEGVSFIATANVGNSYTSTRRMDRALWDRFTVIEMDTLSMSQEFELLKLKFPGLPDDTLKAIADITNTIRMDVKSDSPKLTTIVSTRASVEIASLINDNFTLADAAEVAIYPFFSADGGLDSERTYVKQIVQKYCKNENDTNDLFDITDTVPSDTVPF